MNDLDRRQLLKLATAAAALAAVTGPAMAEADLSDIHTAPELGEMAIGSEDAKVTVIEYASATCPHCADFHEKTYPVLKTEYIDTGKIRFVFREFPFDDLALAAFMLARCAPQDKYFPMIDVLFHQQKKWAVRQGAREQLFAIAQLAGFTEDSFDACLKDEKIAKGIIDIQQKGQKKYGVDSTPTFFINGEKLRGNQDIDAFRKVIDKLLG